MTARTTPGSGTPLFLLSFGARDALAAVAARAGWRAVAARRRDAVERRFVASGAAVAVIDARGALAEGLEALRTLADPVAVNGAVLLALIDAGDRARLAELLDAGATLYLAAPFDEAELVQALRFAARIAARTAAARPAEAARHGLRAADAEGWSLRADGARVALTPPLAARLALPEEVPLTAALRALDRTGRRAARDAVRRVRATGRPTSFAHGAAAGERVVHHLRLDGEAVTGWIEDGGDAQDVVTGPRDALTGLADAAAATDWIAARLAAPVPGCVLLLLAISRFDMINAAFGRDAGDALLKGVGRRIARLAGGDRLVARLAGAEFLVGLPAPATAEEAGFLAARLADAVARPFVAGDNLVTLSCRVGVAAAEAGERLPAPLLRRASAALADAKAGAVRTLDRAGAAAAVRDGALEIDLRRALDADEIGVLFQPQVEVTSGRIVGVEALARWRHPRLGELGADELFAAAARSNYLAELSDHVQRKAAAAAAAWGASLARCRVAINVTALDVARPGFAQRFAGVIDAAGLDRARVTVEVTEGSLIEDLGEAAALLAELRRGGFRIALDDFGTGYSSLAYLKALPLDYIKLDKRLSEDIAGSARDRVVVRGVIEMARSLGLAVIAEGVETEAQLARLAAEGCNYYQGYLCAPPLTLPALERLVARGG